MKRPSSRLADQFRAQHGVVARRQARAAGVTAAMERARVASGQWDRPAPGVLRAAGSPRTAEQALMIAVIAGGPSAVASHSSAAWLWGLLPAPDRPVVTVHQGMNRRIPHAAVHRLTDPPAGASARRNIPCTNPLRTLVDLAAEVDRDTLDLAVDRALAERLVTVEGLEAEIRRLSRNGRRGVGVLRTALKARGLVTGPPASVLESRVLRLLRRGGIEPIGTEVRVGPDGRYRIDLVLDDWVAMEVDGYSYHSSPEQKAYDERRRNELRLAGYLLLVYDWRAVTREGDRVLAECREALARHGTGPARRFVS